MGGILSEIMVHPSCAEWYRTQAPTDASPIEARAAFERCAEVVDFRVSAFSLMGNGFGWKPLTKDCSGLLSDGAKAKCQAAVDGEPAFVNEVKKLGVTFGVSLVILAGMAVVVFGGGSLLGKIPSLSGVTLHPGMATAEEDIVL